MRNRTFVLQLNLVTFTKGNKNSMGTKEKLVERFCIQLIISVYL